MTTAAAKKIRLIALDIDGTLLNDAKEIPPRNRERLHDAVRSGVRVAIASGRMIPSIEPIQERLGIDCALIAYNGGKVVGARAAGRPCLQHRPLEAEIAEQLIRFSLESGHPLNFYLDDRLYTHTYVARRDLLGIYASRTGAQYHAVDLATLIGARPTKLILLADPEERERLYDRFSREFSGALNVTRSDPEYLEFMAPEVDKGTAIPTLASHFAIDVAEIMAVGDADNDLLMLESAGLGVAVANARESVKAVARRVTR
ncbi:MAG: HAD-superfamily hydrolase [Planctomycetota bacterium]|nr:MAG: HAD-superfamily hydrolase [Planctomycetota bacterium]